MEGNLVIGGQLGSYLIESVIGRGGMSVVYRAVHTRLGTAVALKVLAPELSSDDAFRERFLREAKMAAGIDHPNVIPIYDTGLHEGSLYIVMRYVRGGDLKSMLSGSGPLSPEGATAMLTPVARALDAAHALGLVHRDVKPANVLLQRSGTGEVEHVYLSDFGVTKHTTSVSGLTKTGALVGTIDYMAPEQIEGDTVSAQTDVYALGCLYFQCVTGRAPYQQDSEAAVLWAHMHKELEPVSSVRPGLPAALDAAIGKAVAKKPADRFASCGEFLSACNEATATVAESAMTPPPGQETSWATAPGLTRAEGDAPTGGAPPAPPAFPPATPPPLPAGGPNGSGRRGWIGSRPWAAAGLAVLALGGVAAAIALLAGGSDDSKGEQAKTPAGDRFPAKLTGVPTNRVTGTGDATMWLDGRNLTAKLNTKGLLNPASHPLHIHAGNKNKCPPASAATNHGGHQAIGTKDGEAFYGPAVTTLTTRGDTSKQSILVFERYPQAGDIRYGRSFRAPAKTARAIRRGEASVIVHGIDYNKNGVYDAVLDRSDKNPQLNAETTAPALCGPLVPARPQNGAAKAQAGGVEEFTVSLSRLAPDTEGWIEVP